MSAASLAALCLEPAAAGAGVQVGPRPGDRVVVQLAWSGGPEVAWWDAADWDAQVWGGVWTWVDVTCDVRAVTTERGRDSPSERFRVGVATITLANLDRQYSTIDPDPGSPWVIAGRSALGAGTVMRIGYLTDDAPAVTWWPLFTGVAEQWVDVPDFGTGDLAVQVTLTESLAELSHVDRPAAVSQGDGESTDARFGRLLADAHWRWPYRYTAAHLPAVLATTMEGNRVAECYRTADSATGLRFYSDNDGAARVDDGLRDAGAVGKISTNGAPWYVTPVDVTFADDTLRIVNDVMMAHVGGTVVNVVDSASRDRFGPYTYRRLDLLAWDQAAVTDVATDLVQRQAWNVRRLDGFTVAYPDSAPPQSAYPLLDLFRFMAQAALRSLVEVYTTASQVQPIPHTQASIEAVRHHVTFGPRVTWYAAYALEPANVPGPYRRDTFELVAHG